MKDRVLQSSNRQTAMTERDRNRSVDVDRNHVDDKKTAIDYYMDADISNEPLPGTSVMIPCYSMHNENLDSFKDIGQSYTNLELPPINKKKKRSDHRSYLKPTSQFPGERQTSMTSMS